MSVKIYTDDNDGLVIENDNVQKLLHKKAIELFKICDTGM